MDESADSKKKIAFMFCKKWYVPLQPDPTNGPSSNMLYPLEETDKLQFKCRNCKWATAATSNCVYRNDLSTAVGETSGVTQDIGQDPTVGHPAFPDMCTVCGDEICCDDCGKPTASGVWLEVNDADAFEDDDGFYFDDDDDEDDDMSDPASDDDHGMYVVPNKARAPTAPAAPAPSESKEPSDPQHEPAAEHPA
jgi:DNA-directed RNA polymerase II subunit RPB9